MNTVLNPVLRIASGLTLLGLCACSTVSTKLNYNEPWPVALKDKSYVFAPATLPNPDAIRYQNLMRSGLQSKGFTEAADPSTATLKVELNYSTTPNNSYYLVSPYGSTGPYWRFRTGAAFHDPFFYPWWGWPGMPLELEVRHYYQHQLDLVINDAHDGKKLFDASASSETMNESIAQDMPKLVNGVVEKLPN